MIKKQVLNALWGKRDLTIVELGFCDGETTRELLKELSHKIKRYIAVEPVPSLFEQVSKDENLKSVELIHAAISDKEGETELYISSGISPVNGQNFYASSSIKKPNKVEKVFEGMKFDKPIKVRSVTLDALCEGIDVIDLLWSDIQGAEKEMILGGKEALKKTRYIFTEVSEGGSYYDGEIGASELMSMLPEFELVEHFGTDILIKNKRFD